MTMRAGIWFITLLLLAPALNAQDEDDVAAARDDGYQQHAISGLPPQVLAAARAAAPDVYFSDAESFLDNDFRVYRVSGRLFREVWRVFVREDGIVLRTESDIQDD